MTIEKMLGTMQKAAATAAKPTTHSESKSKAKGTSKRR